VCSLFWGSPHCAQILSRTQPEDSGSCSLPHVGSTLRWLPPTMVCCHHTMRWKLYSQWSILDIFANCTSHLDTFKCGQCVLMTPAMCHDIPRNTFVPPPHHLKHFGTNLHTHHICRDICTPMT
jgi:hypothetical protein